MTHIFTPYPRYGVSSEVKRLDHDPNRLHLELDDADDARKDDALKGISDNVVVTDLTSGSQFEILGRAPCGAGCYCGAEVIEVDS